MQPILYLLNGDINIISILATFQDDLFMKFQQQMFHLPYCVMQFAEPKLEFERRSIFMTPFLLFSSDSPELTKF